MAAKPSPADQRLADALACHRAGKLADAEKLYVKLLREEKNNARAMTLLGTLFAQQGKFAEAVKLLVRSLEIDPRQSFALNSLGNAYNALSRHQDALEAFENSIVLKPEAATYSNSGNTLKTLKRYRDALVAYRKALAVDPSYADAYSNSGDLLLELKRYDDAVVSYDKAIALRADSVRDWFGRAVALQESDRVQQALESYDRVVALKKDFAEAWNNRGNALAKLQRYVEALDCYRKAVELNADYAGAYNNWGNALRSLGRFDEAVALYEQAIAHKADYADAYGNRALALETLERHADALESLERGISLEPHNAEFHCSRGNVLRAMKRYDEAVASYEQAIALRPKFSDAFFQKGLALQAHADLEGALASYDESIALKPDFADAHNNRGNVLTKLQRYEDAVKSYDKALQIRPDHAQALSNQGNAWRTLRKYGRALACYDRALSVKPDYVAAHLGRGDMLNRLGRFEEAIASYDIALAHAPADAGAHFRRSHAMRELKRFDEALESIERAVELDPGLAYAVGHRLIVKLHMCDWKGLDEASAAVVNAIELGLPGCVPLPVVCTPALQLRWAEVYAKDKYPPQPMPETVAPAPGARSESDRIRVAYLSSDFHAHATSYLMAGVLEQHDRSRFEVFAISFGKSDGSDMRARVESACEHFVDVRDMSDREVAALLASYQVDIAVDLKGYTKDSRTGILAFRPAPIQVNYLGYPGTMGVGYIDYLIADNVLVPEADQSSYSEKVVYLPDTYQCNDSKRPIAESAPSRAEAGLPETGFVFCSFNNNYKITPVIFDIWMRLLKETEGSVLWLLESNPAAARNLRKEAEARGVDPRRVVFAPWCADQADHLARIRLADLFLDTLPYGAHTTGSDALWAGVPVLTCIGNTFAGRVAASLLNAVGLPELVAHSYDAYETQALKLARDPALIDEVKAKLARNRMTQPLFDTVRFTKHLEAAYACMQARHASGQPPLGFAVDATSAQ